MSITAAGLGRRLLAACLFAAAGAAPCAAGSAIPDANDRTTFGNEFEEAGVGDCSGIKCTVTFNLLNETILIQRVSCLVIYDISLTHFVRRVTLTENNETTTATLSQRTGTLQPSGPGYYTVSWNEATKHVVGKGLNPLIKLEFEDEGKKVVAAVGCTIAGVAQVGS